LARQQSPAARHFPGAQFGRRARRAWTEVGQRQAKLDQAVVLLASERLGDQLRRIEQFPERISRAGELMADLCGAEAWIYSHEQNSRIRDQDVRQRTQASHGGIILSAAEIPRLHPGKRDENSPLRQPFKDWYRSRIRAPWKRAANFV